MHDGTDLYVQESQRGKGVGKALFGYLGKLAKERDCGRLEWSVLRVSCLLCGGCDDGHLQLIPVYPIARVSIVERSELP